MPLFGLLFIYKGYKRIPKSLLYAPLNRYFFVFRMSLIQFESQPGVQLTPSCSLMFTNATQFQYMRARAVNQIKKRCTVILEEKSNQNLKDFCGGFISAQVLFFSANYQIITQVLLVFQKSKKTRSRQTRLTTRIFRDLKTNFGQIPCAGFQNLYNRITTVLSFKILREIKN